MTTRSGREFSPEEIDWLNSRPIGQSHMVGGNENLAGCDDCDWIAEGFDVDHLQEKVTGHLDETLTFLSEETLQERRQDFVGEFGWDPWAEGFQEMDSLVLVDGLEISEEDEEGEEVVTFMPKVITDWKGTGES